MASTTQPDLTLDAEQSIDEPMTSVVLPTHNEAGNIRPLIRELIDVFGREEMAAFRPYELIFVDDSTDDETPRILRDLAERIPEVKVLFLRRQWGQSAALAAGFDHARGAYIVPMDADGQNDPRDIPRLLEGVLEGYDCVSGWRRDRKDPWHKTIPSAIQTKLAKYTGPKINDFGCTLKAYRAEALDEIDLYGEGHRYIPAKLYKRGYAIDEREVNHRPRTHGTSRYGVGRLVRGFVDLVFYWFWVQYGSRPIHLLGAAGLGSMGLGVSIGLLSVIQKYAFGVELAPRTPRLILVALLIVFGIQLLVFGVLAELYTKLYYRDDTEYRIEAVVGE